MYTRTKKLVLGFVVSLLLSIACSLTNTAGENIKSVEVIHPSVGDVYPIGEPINFEAITFATMGISRVAFKVNGQIIQTVTVDDQPQLLEANFSWVPMVTGDMVLEIILWDTTGSAMDSGPVNFRVEEGGDPTPEETDMQPTETEDAPADPASPLDTDTPETNESYVPTLQLVPTETSQAGLIVTLNVPIYIRPSVEQVSKGRAVPAYTAETAIATCPEGATLVSGGFKHDPGMVVT